MKRLGATGKLVLLPTLGGQTALNTAMALNKNGAARTSRCGNDWRETEAIHKAKTVFAFKELMLQIGLDVPISRRRAQPGRSPRRREKIGKFPLIIRPAFTARRHGRWHRLQSGRV